MVTGWHPFARRVPPARYVYRHAEEDRYVRSEDPPARRVAKPRRLASTRRALSHDQLAEIVHIAATTGNFHQPVSIRVGRQQHTLDDRADVDPDAGRPSQRAEHGPLRYPLVVVDQHRAEYQWIRSQEVEGIAASRPPRRRGGSADDNISETDDAEGAARGRRATRSVL